MSKKGLKRAVEIFKYSDSEPNEVFTGLLHLAILPLALYTEMVKSPWLCLFSMAVGAFQLYAVLYNGSLKLRSNATKLAAVVAVATVLNYYIAGLLTGSRVGWLLVLIFAIWNVVRVDMQKHLS